MMLINGVEIREQLEGELKEMVVKLDNKPCLAVIQVGDNQASNVYVRNKERACERVGIETKTYKLPEETTEEELLDLINVLNHDNSKNGILVQLPLPKHLSVTKVLEAIDPSKDVDGFHYSNVGKMFLGLDTLLPCTPHGVMKMLEYIEVEIEGKHAVVVGASDIVGKPMAQLLLQEGATVTQCHIKTKDLAFHTKQADILVVAVGKEKLITVDMVKEGAIVIDVGINRNAEGKLCGDVDFENVKEKVSAISPVPKGVGAMTVAMLLYNTLKAYVLQNS